MVGFEGKLRIIVFVLGWVVNVVCNWLGDNMKLLFEVFMKIGVVLDNLMIVMYNGKIGVGIRILFLGLRIEVNVV